MAEPVIDVAMNGVALTEAEIAAAVADAASKKAVGRPKKTVVKKTVKICGIVDKPINELDSMLEMVYYNPSLFKKLMSLYKAFEVDTVEMFFDENGLKMVTTDHIKKSTIYTYIDGRCMNLYYCKERVRIVVKRAELEVILGTLTKTQYKITFTLGDDYRSHMGIIINDSEYDSEEHFQIDIQFSEGANEPVYIDNDVDYPLRFMVTSKHFKTKIGNISKLSDTLRINRHGNAPLEFTYERAPKINYANLYNSDKKIELKSTLAANEKLSVCVHIEHIRPFSNSNIGDDVIIAVDKNKKISFTTFLDKKDEIWAASVKVFTEIRGAGNESALKDLLGRA